MLCYDAFDAQKNNPKKCGKQLRCYLDPQIINNDDFSTDDNQQKATIFNKYFASVVDQIRSTMTNSTFNIDRLTNFVTSRKDPSTTFIIPAITKTQIVDNLLKFRPDKAVGIDKIGARLLRIAAPVIASSLQRIIWHIS